MKTNKSGSLVISKWTGEKNASRRFFASPAFFLMDTALATPAGGNSFPKTLLQRYVCHADHATNWFRFGAGLTTGRQQI
jgi:hypothetical protein